MKKKFVRVCPRCGSNNIFRPSGASSVSPEYFCINCNFHSPLFPEVSQAEAKLLSKKSINFPRYKEQRKDSKINIILKIITILVVLGILYLFFSVIFKPLFAKPF